MTRARDVADTQENNGGAVTPYVAGKNALINGAIDFAQRGTTFTTVGGTAYTLDRFITRTSTGTGSVVTTQELTNDTTNLPSIKSCARLRRSTGNTSTSELQLSQAIESSNSIQFVGSRVTLSFYARKSANFSGTSFSANILSGTGTDQSLPVTFTGAAVIGTSSITLTTTWTRYTVTTSAVVASTVKQLGIWLGYAGVGTAAADDYFEVTGIQLEMGSVATTFSRNSGTIQGELAACQRYYQRITPTASGQNYGVGFIGGGGYDANLMISFPVEMRTRPTALEQSGTAADYSILQASAYTCNTVPTFQTSTSAGIRIQFVSATLLTAGSCVMGRSTSATAYLGWSAEL